MKLIIAFFVASVAYAAGTKLADITAKQHAQICRFEKSAQFNRVVAGQLEPHVYCYDDKRHSKIYAVLGGQRMRTRVSATTN